MANALVITVGFVPSKILQRMSLAMAKANGQSGQPCLLPLMATKPSKTVTHERDDVLAVGVEVVSEEACDTRWGSDAVKGFK